MTDTFVIQSDDFDTSYDPPSVGRRKKKTSWHHIDFDQGVKRRKSSNEGECFLCKYGASDQARETHEHIRSMLKLIRDGLTRLPLDVLASDVAEYYRVNILEKSLSDGSSSNGNLPEFSQQDVTIHIQHHITSPTVIMVTRIQRIREMICFVEDHVVKRSDDDQIEIDTKMVKSLVDLTRELTNLMNQAPRQSFLSDKYLESKN